MCIGLAAQAANCGPQTGASNCADRGRLLGASDVQALDEFALRTCSDSCCLAVVGCCAGAERHRTGTGCPVRSTRRNLYRVPSLAARASAHWSLRMRRQDPVATPISPLQAGLLGSWLVNAVVLAIVNALTLTTIVSSGHHLGESAFKYIVVLFVWGWSLGAGIAGWGIAVMLRDRRQARGS